MLRSQHSERERVTGDRRWKERLGCPRELTIPRGCKSRRVKEGAISMNFTISILLRDHTHPCTITTVGAVRRPARRRALALIFRRATRGAFSSRSAVCRVPKGRYQERDVIVLIRGHDLEDNVDLRVEPRRPLRRKVRASVEVTAVHSWDELVPLHE
jgi:hypothetical protein